MAIYNPKTWETGETIDKDELDHIEQGIANVSTNLESLTQQTNTIETNLTTEIGNRSSNDTLLSNRMQDSLNADIGTYTSQVIIPCNDISNATDGSVVNGVVRKSGRILYVNGEIPSTQKPWRVCIYGQLDAADGSPSSQLHPSWYEFGDCPGFEVGKEYGLSFIVLSGTAPEFPIGSGTSGVYVTCRRRAEEAGASDSLFVIYNGQTQECTVKPEMIAVTLPAGTYENAQIYVKIYDAEKENRLAALEADVTSKAEQITALETQVDTLESENEKLYTLLKATLPQGSAGPQKIVSCTNAANIAPADLKITFQEQKGDGDPTPDNKRPIVGMTGCTINQHNQTPILFDIPDYDEGVIKVINGNHLIINGVDSMALETQIGLNTSITIPSGQTAHIKFLTNQSIIGPAKVILYAERFTEIANGNLGDEISFTTEEATTISSIAFSLYREGSYPPPATYDIDGYLYLLYGENELVSATYPISWENEAGTVYGGILDIPNKTLTITHKHLRINDDTIEQVMDIQQHNGGNRCGFKITNSLALEKNVNECFLCNIAKPDASVNLTNSIKTPYTCALYRGGNEQKKDFYFRYVFPTTITTNSDAKNFLVNNGCEITYPLVEPIVIKNIELPDIKMFDKINTLTTNAGEINLKYFKDCTSIT